MPAPRFGRAVQATGLFVMLAAIVWGLSGGDLGPELLVAGAGFALVLIGRSLQGGAG